MQSRHTIGQETTPHSSLLTPLRLAKLVLFLLLSIPAMAQDKLFTLEDLNFGGTNYRNLQPKNIYLTWHGEELMYQDVEECGRIDTRTAKKTRLATLDDINTALTKADGATKATDSIHSFLYCSFPYPKEPLILLANTKRRVLYNYRKHAIAWQQTAEGETHEEFCPESKATAFVKDCQLYVTTADGRRHQLTTDGSREIVYGQTVHRDMFGIVKGTFWSPDGQKLAFYRMDQSMVEDYPQVNTFTPIATHEPDKYPMAGRTSHKVTVGVYDLTTGKTIYLQAGDPTDRYFTCIAWDPDGHHIYMIELDRKQRNAELIKYNADTGARLACLNKEHNDKYVSVERTLSFLPWDAREFIFQSCADGFNHLYLFDKDKGLLRQLTKGQWMVDKLIGFNKKTKSVIVASTERGPINMNLYAIDVQTGRRTLLDNGRGYHPGTAWMGSPLSAEGTMIFDRYSEPDVPRNIDVIDTKTARPTRLLTADDPWKEYRQPQFLSGTIKADDNTTDLYWRMVRPHDFDPAKKYPTVVYVYGGPNLRNIDARWHYDSRSWETYMAQKGYIIFILDNRGSTLRGMDFEQVTYGQLGQVEMRDQMRGVEYLRSLGYVDMDRLGVHGWSYGGYMTISLMTNYPDVFKVGVAGGPVIDWKWYEVMYGEQFMDTPQDNPDGYAKTSLLNKAKDLKGRLQIIIGMNDDVVVPQHALSFLNACTEAGTQPDFFVYPGEPHNMRGHKSVHLHERITRYFEDYLK